MILLLMMNDGAGIATPDATVDHSWASFWDSSSKTWPALHKSGACEATQDVAETCLKHLGAHLEALNGPDKLSCRAMHDKPLRK